MQNIAVVIVKPETVIAWHRRGELILTPLRSLTLDAGARPNGLRRFN
jgi:hypothetical protein